MTTRAETAAATRRALIGAAAELLDEGGPNAVTLRAVGARAGTSRGAPYGHFENKEELLTALAVEGWLRVSEWLEQFQAAAEVPAPQRLQRALAMMLSVAREQPHLYALMFSTPQSNPEPLLQAASNAQELFLAIIAESVNRADARKIGALLISTTHGIAGIERAGHLGSEKWGVTGDELLELIVQRFTN
ncbi:TetR/AcrR family transcriptional regulator [Psychromicrobium sp. YIM B11713]|uniref:TetR/AcrR family transcriptional regulator n=1 Tax=Psychromicrobium sp. YIM B11713 TaxID=3145233 RepID=UPI00374F64DE